MTSISYVQQQHITRLCVRCGLLLMQYGAESAVVVDLSKRLGLALGMNSVECSLNFNAITLTTICDERCITTTRDTINQSINVNVLVQIQQIVNKTESTIDNAELKSELTDRTTLAFDELDNKSVYPTWLVGVFVGASCAAFAYLNGGSWSITAVTFIAGMVAMFTRIYLSKHHFNPFIAVIVTAFIASLIGATTYYFDIGNNADIAVASSVLLLVPSFPLINSFSDILKGYVNIGVGRAVFTYMLTLSACVGIVMALVLLRIQHWGF
ncbi:possible ThrE family exporter, large subunit [Psychrobacter arcticus 273-4]|uniref:Possible ThrE family exporter, large subunit n=1 Tax=Psychrobacter arcticus (strain DSM 17307 / VKM B-2377 / 273-4) TaxID=259536 RepID=Q4FR19_PSYA2|nr:threonine/serine exporter family protein [Psychrobacter arcticus]AAZ19539.1 possible ThrE family exporter, large subunit [Psychrobacter arcticus 273-4]